MARKKISDTTIETMLAWKKENKATHTQTALHFGEDAKRWQNGLQRYRKTKLKNTPQKDKYMTAYDLPTQEVTPLESRMHEKPVKEGVTTTTKKKEDENGNVTVAVVQGRQSDVTSILKNIFK